MLACQLIMCSFTHLKQCSKLCILAGHALVALTGEQGCDTPIRLVQVGLGAMLVAAKYEEIYAPQISEFCFITDNTYSRQEVSSLHSYAAP